MDTVHVSSFLTHPAFTMNSISAASESPVVAPVSPGPTGREKKKSCCPFGECKYRMKATDSIIVCRCGASFCPSHRLPEQHSCGFNYRAAATQHLSSQLIKCAGDRLADKL